MTAPPDDTTTDPQAIIAALRAERDAALAREGRAGRGTRCARRALAQRNTEYGERIEHQAATIDVLKAMSASPGDAQPVFDLIVERARDLCNVPTAAVATFDGTMMHLAVAADRAPRSRAYAAQFPTAGGVDFAMGRAILDRAGRSRRDIGRRSRTIVLLHALGHWSSHGSADVASWMCHWARLLSAARAWAVLRQPDRTAENLRRAGGDRHHQRRDVSRVANPHERSSGNRWNTRPRPATC